MLLRVVAGFIIILLLSTGLAFSDFDKSVTDKNEPVLQFLTEYFDTQCEAISSFDIEKNSLMKYYDLEGKDSYHAALEAQMTLKIRIEHCKLQKTDFALFIV